MINILQKKVELEHLWTKKYKERGVYTTDMVPLTNEIKKLTRELIIK